MFTLGRIMLGLLMIVQGVVFYQGGFKDQLSQMKELRLVCQKLDDSSQPRSWFTPVMCPISKLSPDAVHALIYTQMVLMVLSGTLMIASIKAGGILMAAAMALLILTRDNPALGTSELSWRVNFQNALRDLAVAGVGLLVFMRREIVKHRRL